MEAALLSGVLRIAVKKLAPLITSEFAYIVGVKKDLSKLEHLFRAVTSWLSAVEVKIADNDPSHYWLKDLKAVAGDFDDLLEQVHLEAEKRNADVDVGKNVIANWYAKGKYVVFQPKIAQEIKKIKKRFAAIVKERIDFNAIAMGPPVDDPVQHINRGIREMSLLTNIDERKVLGRDDVKHEIISKLVKLGTRERISIVSISGLGGSGKTTLAKYICQDNKIEVHFDNVFWVEVSEEFNVEKLIGKLFESFSDRKSEQCNLHHMAEAIKGHLSGRKFLLVLDDVWNKDPHVWEQFEQHFNSGAPGSKILLTTRDGKVAQVVESTDIFNLTSLSDDDSWKLCQQSSGWAEEGLDSDFVEVGKEIVKKCAGVPLAIKCLGGVLRDMRQIREWRALRDSNLLNYLDIKDRVSGSLRLSYFHLPDDLKQCLLLCSIFPKGYFMCKHHLISQWIAHGFINPMNGGQLPEDVGSDYFDYLVKVSFLQDLCEDPITGKLECKLHDLVHDLTREILQDDIVLTPNKTSTEHNQHQRCRYLSLASCTEKLDSELFNKVRAIFVTGGRYATDKPIEKGCHVRSIILEHIYNTSVLLFVLKFENIGYLRIFHVLCRELPEAITGCWNLQALHVIRCYRFAMLPESIGKLRKLRTLELSGASDLESLPESIGDCHNLESLHLIECSKFSKIPDSLGKNENLRLLNIVNCSSLLHLPSRSFGMLRKLQTMNLSACRSLEDLPSSFTCDELHTLKLHGCGKLTMLPQCISSLSNLEHIDLGYCSELVELPEDIRNLKRLKVLNLQGCRKLRGLPAGFAQLTRLQRLSLFIIGDSTEHARISELGNLDMISGTLIIDGIRYVKDREDAEKACLKKKNNIDKLVLTFRCPYNLSKVGEEVGMEQELAVLNSLEPPSGIKKLKINGYGGLRSPCWLTKERHLCNFNCISKQIVDLPHFPQLTSMNLDGFKKLKHLTELVELPSLKILKLSGFYALENISVAPFPSLTELRISGMHNLCELSTTAKTLTDEDGVTVCGNQGVDCCFPRLSTLVISDCPKLNVNPCFPASLESLMLAWTNEGLLFPAIFFCPVHPHGGESELLPSCSNINVACSCSSLKKLDLRNIAAGPSDSSWQLLRYLSALESLEIMECSELRQLPESMRSLTSLQQLNISRCSCLCALPKWLGELRSLQGLEIKGCHALHQLPEVGLGELRSLRTLSLVDLSSLSYLPESIRGLASLQRLFIGKCDVLHQLPEGLGKLHSLRTLSMWALPALSYLPESMQGLTSLERLYIRDCVTLHRLPDALGELRSLQNFTIYKLPALTCLPESIQSLTLLHVLLINSCYALSSLPESIGQLSALKCLIAGNCGLTSLPRSIQHLTALETLNITGNPHLARRYKQGTGKDWHLIRHIPNVQMDYTQG